MLAVENAHVWKYGSRGAIGEGTLMVLIDLSVLLAATTIH